MNKHQMPKSPEELAAIYVGWVKEHTPEWGASYAAFLNAYDCLRGNGLISEDKKGNYQTWAMNFRLEGYSWFPQELARIDSFALHFHNTDPRVELAGFSHHHALKVGGGNLFYSQEVLQMGSPKDSEGYLINIALEGGAARVTTKLTGEFDSRLVKRIKALSRDGVLGLSRDLPPVLASGLDNMVQAMEAYQG